MPMLAAIIAVVMEVPAAILIILGFFTRPLAVLFIFYTLGTAVIGHHYWDMTGDAVGPNMINFWKNISIAGAFLLLAITGPGQFLSIGVRKDAGCGVMNCTPNVGHNLTSEGAVYETFI